MKFRGKMVDAMSMRQFSNTVATLSRLGKRCVLRLTPDTVYFIIAEDGAPRRPLVWCVLQQAHFFNDYNLIGVSDEFNEIYLEFSPDMLAKALVSLKSAQNSKSMKMKLTKKRTACLTCEIELPTMLQHSRICTHDIPVEVVPRREWPNFVEPAPAKYDVCIHMPNLKRVKTVCDRMKCLSQHVLVSANRQGVLSLKVESDLVTAITYFKELVVEGGGNSEHEDSRDYTARVDCKKLVNFLSIEQVNPSRVVCEVVDRRLLHMHVLHDDVTLHYYIPAILR